MFQIIQFTAHKLSKNFQIIHKVLRLLSQKFKGDSTLEKNVV